MCSYNNKKVYRAPFFSVRTPKKGVRTPFLITYTEKVYRAPFFSVRTPKKGVRTPFLISYIQKKVYVHLFLVYVHLF